MLYESLSTGNLSTPTTLVSGCAYEFYLPDREELYVKLTRPSAKHVLSVKWDYKYEYKPPLHVFSWDGQCCLGQHPHINVELDVIYGDFVQQPMGGAGSEAFMTSSVVRGRG